MDCTHPRHRRLAQRGSACRALLLLALLASIGAPRAFAEEGAGDDDAAAAPVVDVRPHSDEVVAAALERFKKSFAKPSMDARLRILQWLGRHRHKKVLRTLSKILTRDRNLEIKAMAARGIGYQLSEAKSARKVLTKALDKFKRYGSREAPEDDEIEAINEEEAQILVACVDGLRALHPHAPKRHKRDGWDAIEPLIDHMHDDVAIAVFRYCGETKEYRGLPRILEWFNYYPDGHSWNGASATVDTGTAGSADAKAARAKVQRAMAGRKKKARPDAHAEMAKAVEQITGEALKDPKALTAWMKENKRLLQRNGV